MSNQENLEVKTRSVFVFNPTSQILATYEAFEEFLKTMLAELQKYSEQTEELHREVNNSPDK